jgi:hypothetical protein
LTVCNIVAVSPQMAKLAMVVVYYYKNPTHFSVE